MKADHPRRRGRPKPAPIGRWIARILCTLFAIVGLLPVVASALLRTEMASQWAAEEAQRLAREELGLDLSFTPTVRPWPLTIVVDDVQVASTDGTDPAIVADRMTLRPRFFSLLQGRVNAGDIEVDRPRVRLVVRDGKVVNLDVKLRSQPEPEAPPNALPFRRLP